MTILETDFKKWFYVRKFYVGVYVGRGRLPRGVPPSGISELKNYAQALVADTLLHICGICDHCYFQMETERSQFWTETS